jgi:hypothetical protein
MISGYKGDFFCLLALIRADVERGPVEERCELLKWKKGRFLIVSHDSGLPFRVQG